MPEPLASPASHSSAEQLEAHIAHYSARKAPTGGRRVVLELTGPDTARLRILRSGAALARGCERLPAACVDQRDAVARSIALALAHVSTGTAADSGEAEPAPRRVVRAPPAGQGGRP